MNSEHNKQTSACKEITSMVKKAIATKDVVTPGDYLEVFMDIANDIVKDGVDFSSIATKAIDAQFEKLNQYRKSLSKTYDDISKNAEAAHQAMKNGDSSALEAIIKESEDLKAKLAEVEEMAYTDQLTGAKNRRWFFSNYIDGEGNFSKDGVLAILDLNDFKIINDTFGHQAGDRVLQMVVKGFSTAFNSIVRYGGDEFLIIEPIENANIMQKKILELKKMLEEKTIHYSSKSFKISFSIGFKAFEVSSDFASTMEEIDQKMYQDKEKNKNGQKS